MHTSLCHGLKATNSKSVPLSFVSSEGHFLPHLLNINDIQNNARKGCWRCQGYYQWPQDSWAGILNGDLHREASIFERIEFITLLFELGSAWFSIKNFQINTVAFMHVSEYFPLPLPRPCLFHYHWHCLQHTGSSSSGLPLTWAARDFPMVWNVILPLGNSLPFIRFCSEDVELILKINERLTTPKGHERMWPWHWYLQLQMPLRHITVSPGHLDDALPMTFNQTDPILVCSTESQAPPLPL